MSHHDNQPHLVNRNARYGLILFAVYVALYGGFVFLAVFKTSLMGVAVGGGLNLAVAYGFGLIIAALLLALLYMYLCRMPKHPREMSGGGEDCS
ncbi:MAG: hypothetical protein AMXMBFR84_05220 [Candidatus Hydrogenedentota bacterium]